MVPDAATRLRGYPRRCFSYTIVQLPVVRYGFVSRGCSRGSTPTIRCSPAITDTIYFHVAADRATASGMRCDR
jgi:hypothetical protein